LSIFDLCTNKLCKFRRNFFEKQKLGETLINKKYHLGNFAFDKILQGTLFLAACAAVGESTINFCLITEKLIERTFILAGPRNYRDWVRFTSCIHILKALLIMCSLTLYRHGWASFVRNLLKATLRGSSGP